MSTIHQLLDVGLSSDILSSTDQVLVYDASQTASVRVGVNKFLQKSVGLSSTDSVGFYGATPIVRPSAPTAPASTAATSTNPWGFGTSTQADAVVTALRTINTTLTNLGLHG